MKSVTPLTAVLLACAAVLLHGAERPAPKAPPRQELWVPTESLEQILKLYPNAVMLTPEQYDALLRDAGKVKPEVDPAANPPPREILVESLRLRGNVAPGAATVTLSAELILHAPAEGWAQTTLSWPWNHPLVNAAAEGPVLANLRDGRTQQVPADPTSQRHLDLAVKGPGRRVLKFDSVVPLSGSSEFQELTLPPMPCAGLLELELPAGALVTGGSPHEKTAQRVKVPFLAEAWTAEGGRGTLVPVATLSWRLPGAGDVAGVTSHLSGETASARYEVLESEVRAVIFIPRAGNTGLTETTWKLASADTQVVGVSGDAVLSWRQSGDDLILALRPAVAARAVEVHLRKPWEDSSDGLTLPALTAGSPLKAHLDLSVSEGLELLSTSGAIESDGQSFFSLGGTPLILRVQTARVRLEADVDALVKLERDSVNIQRTLNLRCDRPQRQVRLTIPAAEEFISVTSPAAGFEWKRVDRTLELRFTELLKPGAGAAVTLTSRKKLIKAWTAPRIPEAVFLENIAIPEAVKLAGYTALQFDDAWRVGLRDVRGLEDRDARLTPVKGRMAWFGLRAWSLGLEVERAESIFSAEVTAYALPRARTVEIEGQFSLEISGAPLRSFQVKLPPAIAGLLRVTSPLVGEQQLDEGTGQWTFTLRQETKGRPEIRFRMSLPAAGAQETTATLPHLEMPQARRFHGTWIIEANTDTQLSFESRSMQPLDVLRAPVVAGYQPRHRLVSAFTYGSGAHRLSITARRHDRSELAVLIVKSLRMTSVLSPDGASRHEAVINLRHSGEQFITVRLPGSAQLLSVLVEHGSAKPVRGEDGTLAIPLPADSANRSNVRVAMLYDLASEAWAGSGASRLVPVTFPGSVPILSTDWRVHAPEGYTYGKVRTNFAQEEGAVPESPGARARRSLPAQGQSDQISRQTEDQLRQLILPRVQMNEAPMADAVNFLRSQLLRQDQIHLTRDIRIVYLPGDIPVNARITLDLADIPFIDALKYITELAGMRYRITAGKVTISPHLVGDEEMLTRVFKVPSDIVDRLGGQGQMAPAVDPFPRPPANDPFSSSTSYDSPEPAGAPDWWVETFKAQGIVMGERARVIFDDDRSELVVVNSQANLDLAELFIDSLLTPDERAAFGTIKPPSGPQEEPTDYITRKMRNIIFPAVEFADATVEEAIEFLAVKSRDLDPDPDPARKGMSVIYKPGDTSNPSKISLSLKDVPMDVALRYVTELAGMKYKVEPFAILIVPVSDTTTERYTRSFRVPPDFLTSIGSGAISGSGGLMARASTIDILKSQGIQFDDGASAIFNPVTSQLIVTNTLPNLDLIEMYVDSMSRQTPPQVQVLKSGLLPLNLELPTSGILLRFQGAQAPEPLLLPFTSWERQLALASLWMLLGAAAFAWWGRKRLSWRTLFVILVMRAAVPLLAPALQTVANGLLIGWLIAVAAWLFWRLVVRMAPAVTTQSGEEVAA